MATDLETPPDTEYEKPDPVANPRNIAMKEIAATVAKQHAEEIKETFPTIDEDGVVTPPASISDTTVADADPADTAAAAEDNLSVAPPPASKETAAVPDGAILPDQEYEVTIEGVKQMVKGSALIDAGRRTFQKETAADYKLKMASELLTEAERRAKESTPRGDTPPPADAPKDVADADLAKALQFGTPEESAAAVAQLRKRGTDASPEQIAHFVAQQTRLATRDEIAFNTAENFVKSEYTDLLANDYLKRLFYSEEARYRAPKERGGLADQRPYLEVYKDIGENLRKAFNMPKTDLPAVPGSPSTGATAKDRQDKKAQTPPPPRSAASRLAAADSSTKAKTPSEIIEGMAASRGKNRLVPQLRKET